MCVPNHCKVVFKWNTAFQEDKLTGRPPHRMMTLQEDDYTGRKPHRKKTYRDVTSQEDDHTGRHPHRKTISKEDNLKGR